MRPCQMFNTVCPLHMVCNDITSVIRGRPSYICFLNDLTSQLLHNSDEQAWFLHAKGSIKILSYIGPAGIIGDIHMTFFSAQSKAMVRNLIPYSRFLLTKVGFRMYKQT